jgi:hypothetical protein
MNMKLKQSNLNPTINTQHIDVHTCGNLRSDPLSLENPLSQKTRISLFSDAVVRSAAVKLSADLSHRFLEKQNTTT